MLLILASIVGGAVLQRVSGIGFAVVVAPFVVLALGPGQGIVLVQVFGAIICLFVLASVWRDVDWKAYAALVPPSLAGIVAGAWAAGRLPAAEAQIVTACLLIVSLVTVMVARSGHLRRSMPALMTGGAAAGIMTALAGAGGVALIVLARATGWEHRSFAATLQPYLITLSSSTVVAKLVVDPETWPGLPWWQWAVITVSMLLGLLAGNEIARRISRSAASKVTLAVAWVGAIAALADGIAKLG